MATLKLRTARPVDGATLAEPDAQTPEQPARRRSAHRAHARAGAPQSRYFVLGRVGRDQVEDYARRKGWTVDEAEKWLSPNLGYRTEDE